MFTPKPKQATSMKYNFSVSNIKNAIMKNHVYNRNLDSAKMYPYSILVSIFMLNISITTFSRDWPVTEN